MKNSIVVQRTTKETDIHIEFSPRGSGKVDVSTGLGFADHMLTLFAFWARFDLLLRCAGDLQVDAHHTLEDVGLCLGSALDQALEDRAGIARVGWAKVPMDEALAEVVVDFSGRPFFVYRETDLPLLIGGQEKDVWREMFKSIAFSARMNLHILFHYGRNGHHLLESACKGMGLAMRQGLTPIGETAFSTKGSLG